MRRWSYAVILAVIIAGVYLQGCAETVIIGGVVGVGGTMYLEKDRARMLVTENEKDVAGCEFKKEVEESRAWGGLLLQDEAMERVIADLTTETVEAGGNVLLIRKKRKRFMGSSATGEAYRCPDNNALAPTVTPNKPGQ